MRRRVDLMATPRISAKVRPAAQFGSPELVSRVSALGRPAVESIALMLFDVRVHGSQRRKKRELEGWPVKMCSTAFVS